jgi:hypothetical protein
MNNLTVDDNRAAATGTGDQKTTVSSFASLHQINSFPEWSPSFRLLIAN